MNSLEDTVIKQILTNKTREERKEWIEYILKSMNIPDRENVIYSISSTTYGGSIYGSRPLNTCFICHNHTDTSIFLIGDTCFNNIYMIKMRICHDCKENKVIECEECEDFKDKRDFLRSNPNTGTRLYQHYPYRVKKLCKEHLIYYNTQYKIYCKYCQQYFKHGIYYKKHILALECRHCGITEDSCCKMQSGRFYYNLEDRSGDIKRCKVCTHEAMN